MRIGIIGVGRIGALHAETLHSLAEVDELIVVDADTARARQVASSMGVSWAEDAETLLHDGVDGLVIATPTDTHAALISAAAKAGIAVFCEKPVATDVAGTREVVRQVEKSGAQVQVGFQRRFDVGFVSAREQVQARSWGGCTPSERARSTPPRLRPRTSLPRAGYSGTAASTTSTPFAGSPDRTCAWSTPPGPTGEPTTSSRPGTSTRLRRCSPWKTIRWLSSPQPDTTPQATTSDWNCSARRAAFRWGSMTGCRCARPNLE